MRAVGGFAIALTVADDDVASKIFHTFMTATSLGRW